MSMLFLALSHILSVLKHLDKGFTFTDVNLNAFPCPGFLKERKLLHKSLQSTGFNLCTCIIARYHGSITLVLKITPSGYPCQQQLPRKDNANGSGRCHFRVRVPTGPSWTLHTTGSEQTIWIARGVHIFSSMMGRAAVSASTEQDNVTSHHLPSSNMYASKEAMITIL